MNKERTNPNDPGPSGSPRTGQIPGRVEHHDHALMSIGDHLEDLRRRVAFSIIGIIPIFVVAFMFGRPLLSILITPARRELEKGGHPATLLATAPFETFGTVVHLSVVVTILIGAPWILYQLWLFISPGLYAHERRIVHLLIPFSGLLTLLSIAFLYFVILPVILAFFISYASSVSGTDPGVATAPLAEGVVLPTIPVLDADPVAPEIGATWINSAIQAQRVCIGLDPSGDPIVRSLRLVASHGILQQYKISEYIKTVLNMGLAFAIAFQTPVVIVMLGWVGIINPRMMGRFRKMAIAVCAVLGALLTPADPLSMVLLAVPLYLLYELGLFILRVLPLSRVLGDTRPHQDPDAVTPDHHEADS